EEEESEEYESNDNETLSQTNLVLEKTVNLRDPIFQERDIEPYENLIHSSNHSIESSNSINIDFNLENLVDSILNTELDD
ncbi:24037_t:CDS:1, partial [Dentiscutata erythropus]